jgi:orotidine-5'-phosphate decarboxylase
MKRPILSAADRLIVAADFKPIPPHVGHYAKDQVLALADKLKGTGVCFKVNSALRACGYNLVDEIHDRGLQVFADLKLYDIPETLSTDGEFLRLARPELLTVVCTTGAKAMMALKAELPNTEVLGVTVLTSQKDTDTQAMFACKAEEGVLRFAEIASLAEIDGLISSPAEAEMLRAYFKDKLTINTPAIRPTWAIVPGDDQNPDRIMTPAKAIKAGADRIVVGRPILLSADPRSAVMRTIDEIEKALQEK